MLSGYLNKILESLIGDFLDENNTQLELNKWQGVGEKKYIKMKDQKIKDLFAVIGLDVEVVEASIGLLQFTIPWNKIWKEPTRIVIRELFVNVATKAEFNDKFQAKQADLIKQSLLQKHSKKLIQKDKVQNFASLKKFFSQMFVIEIENFHLRIEDKGTSLRNTTFNFGIQFKTLSFRPTECGLCFKLDQFTSYLLIEKVENQSNLIEPFSMKLNILRQPDLTQIDINFDDKIALNIDNLQFSAILKLMQLRKWSCQQGEHLRKRPPFNIRPRHNQELWRAHLAYIVQYLNERKKHSHQEWIKVEQKRLLRNEYLNLYLADQLFEERTIQAIVINDISMTQLQIKQRKLELEQNLLVEELIMQRSKAFAIIRDEEALKQILSKWNFDQEQYSKFSLLSYFWRKNTSNQNLDWLNNLIKEQPIVQESQSSNKQYDFLIKQIIINYRIVVDKFSSIFMKQDFMLLSARVTKFQQDLNVMIALNNIIVQDCVNPNREFMIILSRDESANRSKKKQYENQHKPLFNFHYIQSQDKQSLTIKIESMVMSLNDTIMVRLQTYLMKIGKHDQFHDLVSYTLRPNKLSVLKRLENLCLRHIKLDFSMSTQTLKIPESAVKKNCPVLQIIIGKCRLHFFEQLEFNINGINVIFSYDTSVVSVVDPFDWECRVHKQLKEGAEIEAVCKFGDIVLRIPLLNTMFFQNFVCNVMSTLSNIKRFNNLPEQDEIFLSAAGRKRSQSFQHSSISRIDETSSQNSDVFYDADEFFDIHQPLKSSSSTPFEKREYLIKQWQKLQQQLTYIVDVIYKNADPYAQQLVSSLQIKTSIILPKISLIIDTQKHKNSLTLLNLNIEVAKPYKSLQFHVDINTEQINLDIFKLNTLQKLAFLYSNTDPILQDLNRNMYQIIPILLRVKVLEIFFNINVNQLNIKFLRQQDYYLHIQFTQIQAKTDTFTLQYRQKFNQPFFLKQNLRIYQLITNLKISMILRIEYLNQKLRERKIYYYEPFLENTNIGLTFDKSLEGHSVDVKIDQLLLNITPQLFQTLVDLNSFCIRLEDHLQVHDEPMLRKQSDSRLQYQINSTDGYKIQIQQLEPEIDRSRYQIDLFQTDEESNVTHVIVNLTQQKLLFQVNSLEYQILPQEQKGFSSHEKLKVQFTTREQSLSCVLPHELGIVKLRLFNKLDRQKQSFFLVRLQQLHKILVYSVEQQFEAPYLVKNKSSQPIIISQPEYLHNKIVIDQGDSAGFSWDDPLNNKQLLLQIEARKFTIDIDGFKNKELYIDKRNYQFIDKEFTIELFNDGEQKIIILNEKDSIITKQKTIKFEVNQIGLSFVNNQEILYISTKNLIYLQKDRVEYTIYILECSQTQMDNQSQFIPKRWMKVHSDKEYVNINQQFKSVFSKEQVIQQTNRKIPIFRIEIKQKNISQIMTHLRHVKITMPNVKIKIEGQLIVKLFQFYRTAQSLIQMRNRGISGDSMVHQQVQPKPIHIDSMRVTPFKFRLKFKKLHLAEADFVQLWSKAGLVIFLLTQMHEMDISFEKYKYKTQEVIMTGNHQAHINLLSSFYSNRLQSKLTSSLTPSQLLAHPKLLRQCHDEIQLLVNNLNDSDMSQSYDFAFRYQLLQTGLKIGQSVLSAFQDSLATVLTGLTKVVETMLQRQEGSSIANRLTKLFQYLKLPKAKKYQIQNLCELFNLKVARPPRYIQCDLRIRDYDQQFAKAQLYLMWQINEGHQFKRHFVFKLKNHFILLLTQFFTIIDLANNQIILEVKTKQIRSVINIDNTCLIKYSTTNPDKEVSMSQLRIDKKTLPFEVDLSFLPRLKEFQESIEEQQNQVFVLAFQ